MAIRYSLTEREAAVIRVDITDFFGKLSIARTLGKPREVNLEEITGCLSGISVGLLSFWQRSRDILSIFSSIHHSSTTHRSGY
jgi:hypothetical protein